MSARAPTIANVAGKRLSFSNLDKPLYPNGFTKGEVIDYYRQIAPILLKHTAGRAITLKRYPNGSQEKYFFEKNCNVYRPEWIKTVPIKSKAGSTNYCVIDDLPSLLWAANLGSLELHVPLALAKHEERPTSMVFDLDPGPEKNVLDCARLSLRLRDVLKRLDLESFAKTSGGKGIHVYVPLNRPGYTFEDTKAFSRAIALIFEKQNPKEIVSLQDKSLRKGKILIDWSQNDQTKTTVCAYSLRAQTQPTVSTPVTWKEIETNVKRGDIDGFTFTSDKLLKRVKKVGDLFDVVLKMKQVLPNV